MKQDRSREVLRWLESIPGGGASDTVLDDWVAFSSQAQPVITLFGSYDTGKSALLRRLLIEDGRIVPEWLTISARHETFEVNELGLGGCLVRDTPGFVVGASDLRADVNSLRAEQAVQLTDIAVVVVTPQLPTAEHERLRTLASQEWSAGGLWWVIARFDEAGVDPEGDLPGYRVLAERKVSELRESIELADEVPVFVVSADYAGMAGSQRNPDPSIWEDSRAWDGITEVLTAIQEVSTKDLASLREDAASRYWVAIVEDTLEELSSRSTEYGSNLRTAQQALRRRDSWLQQLEALRLAARNSLDAAIQGAVSSVRRQEGADVEDMKHAVTSRLELWSVEQGRQLEELASDVDVGMTRQFERPSWEGVEELLDQLRGESADGPEPAHPTYAPRVEQLVNSLQAAIIEYITINQKSLKDFAKPATDAAKKRVSSVEDVAEGIARSQKYADLITAFGPLLVDAATVFADGIDERNRRRALAAERQKREEQVTNLSRAIGDLAFGQWSRQSQALQDAISEITQGPADLVSALPSLIEEIDEAISVGSALKLSLADSENRP